jgi:hypothetical protein
LTASDGGARKPLGLKRGATIASCDDFKDIVAWGEQHLDFLRRFSEFHFGIPSVRWLQSLVNRVDPVPFGQCFKSWIKELWPDRHDLIAIDGKTSRRTHDKRKGLKALHTLSAYASNARLVLGQLSVPEKTNEITAIPELLDHLTETSQLQGALVTIDAMGCQVAIADKIVEHQADYLLALKGNQPTLEAEVTDYFRSAPAEEVSARPLSRRGMAASKRGPIQLRPRSTGPYPTGAIQASRASPTSRRSSRSICSPNTRIDPGRLCGRGVAQDHDSMTLNLGEPTGKEPGTSSGCRVAQYVTPPEAVIMDFGTRDGTS